MTGNVGGNAADRAEIAAVRAAAAIRALRTRVAELEAAARAGASAQPSDTALDEPIAVVGTACRFPGGCDAPDRFWEFLRAGGHAVERLPAQRWTGTTDTTAAGNDRTGDRGWAGVVADVEWFDAEFFGIGAAEARLMDPQQRLVLETSWEALERAGLPLADVQRAVTGVYLGVGHQDYLFLALAGEAAISAHLGPGNARSIIANRVSYQFGLRGPSVAVDTACSSSLVAVHLASQSLRTGECDVALAGGVNLILAPVSTAVTAHALPLAPDGRTKAFDSAADGMVRGEGCGVVVLKRLADAVRDGDDVGAVILASGCGSDGRSNGLTAPDPAAQRELLAAVLRKAGLRPADVGYVEMHATGTPLGDPIEYEAVAAAYGTGDDSDPTCWLGSVKANIGHLEAAAGIASLIKAVECVRRGEIPPQLWLNEVNPHLDLSGRFAIPRRLQRWDRSQGRPRRAAVSSFGFGGTNAHVVIGEPDTVRRPPGAPDGGREPLLLPLSARSPAALTAQLRAYASLLDEVPDEEVRAVAIAAARRRTAHPYRYAAAAPDPAGLRAEVRRGLARRCGGDAVAPAGPLLVTVCHPAGVSTVDGPELGLPPGARTAVRVEYAAWSVELTARAGDASPERLAAARVVAWLAARAAGWRALGVEPALAVGHGPGALAAAYTAGVTSRTETLDAALTAAESPDATGWREFWVGAAAGPAGSGDPRPAGQVTVDVGGDLAAGYAALARLWCIGCDVDWAMIYSGLRPWAALPTYPWQRSRFWIEPVAPPRPSRAPAGRLTSADLLHRLRSAVADIMDVTDPTEVDVDVPAREIDIDSVDFVELKNRVDDELGVAVPITALMDGASLRQIADRLAAATAASPESRR